MHFGLKDVVTIAIAALGAVLGIVNTWHALNQRRVRLRVVPKLAVLGVGTSSAKKMVCIEVVNLSAFPISLSEIGFTLAGDPKIASRLSVMAPITTDQKPIARTLAPRHGVTGFFEFDNLTPGIKKAYARTECGTTTYGSSPALKHIREAARG